MKWVVVAVLLVPVPALADPGFITLDRQSGQSSASLARLPAYYDTVPRGTSLRLAVSPTLRSGERFARADVGFDHDLATCDLCETPFDMLRLDAGVGVDLGDVAVMGELATLTAFRASDTSTIETAAVSLRGRTGKVEPYAAAVIPLASDLRDAYDFGLTVGVDAPLR